MLHGKVHGPLQTLIARINDLPRKSIQSLLHINIVVRIIQIVVSKTYNINITQNQSSQNQIRNQPYRRDKYTTNWIRVSFYQNYGAAGKALSCVDERTSSSSGLWTTARRTPFRFLSSFLRENSLSDFSHFPLRLRLSSFLEEFCDGSGIGVFQTDRPI